MLGNESLYRPKYYDAYYYYYYYLNLYLLYVEYSLVCPRDKTMSLGDTLFQLLFRFIVSTVYGAYLPRSYVGSDGLLRQHFPENVFIIIIIIIIIITAETKFTAQKVSSQSSRPSVTVSPGQIKVLESEGDGSGMVGVCSRGNKLSIWGEVPLESSCKTIF